MCLLSWQDRLRMTSLVVVSLSLYGALLAHSPVTQAELKPEPIPNVVSLEVPYPASYAIVHDFAFGSLIDSSFGLVDTETQHFKGMLSAGQFATIDFSTKRQKFYVGETLHTRGSRGTRQDVVAIYDFENLDIVGEIDLPPKRMNVVVNESSTAITPDDEFMLVFNMNPATSVTVIDLDQEAVVGEIQTPGCSLIYPHAKSGFFTLCGNGGLVAIGLDDKGQETDRWASEPFNDIDQDPLSEKAALVNGVWYFVSYGGEVQPIDVKGDRPVLQSRWWLTTESERAENWRPAGWHGKGGNEQGLLWVGMTPDGYNGSHKDPATEVWLFDINFDNKKGKRLQRISLKVPALSITASQGDEPQLLVVNIEGSLDVYDGRSGDYVHSLHALGETPYMVHALY
jgi:methylamine dehydrogenase heavy chain